MEPTILDYGSDLAGFSACEAMQDELFGPILPTARFSSLEQVVRLVKELPTGKPLALYCYATDARFIDAVKTLCARPSVHTICARLLCTPSVHTLL